MMEFMKASILGIVLTGVISLVIGSQDTSGGQLAIHLMRAGDFQLYWSWPLFFAGTGLAWGIIIMQR